MERACLPHALFPKNTNSFCSGSCRKSAVNSLHETHVGTRPVLMFRPILVIADRVGGWAAACRSTPVRAWGRRFPAGQSKIPHVLT